MYHHKKILFLISLVLLLGVFCYAAVWQTNQMTELPVLRITTQDGAPLENKEYSEATMELSYPNQVTTEDLNLQIRHRGNTTMKYDKKAYKIELEDKLDLLIGGSAESDNAARDWVLLANAYDKPGLRNMYALLAASQLDGMEYVMETRFVELYLDDVYLGLYQLCEEVEINEGRVEINDEIEDAPALLLERRPSQKQDYFVGTYYGEDEVILYDVHSKVWSAQQLADVTARMYEINESILAGDQATISQMIDLDSCIDMYLLQEFVMNSDVGYGSFYLYMKENDDMIYYGPPWDFDLSMGSDERTADYAVIYAASDVTENHEHPNEWFRDLMKLEWFQDMVRVRWNEKKHIFLESLVEIQRLEENHQAVFEKNYDLWYNKIDLPQEEWKASYDAEYAALYSWIENRYLWLDHYFNQVM